MKFTHTGIHNRHTDEREKEGGGRERERERERERANKYLDN